MKLSFLSAAAWLLTAAAVFAQTSEILGRVTDPQGMVVPAAAVYVQKGETIIGETQADGHGNFHLRNIPSGNYSLKVEAAGFSPILQALSLASGQLAQANLQLNELSGQKQSVVVTSKTLEPSIDLRNTEVFNRTLFTQR